MKSYLIICLIFTLCLIANAKDLFYSELYDHFFPYDTIPIKQKSLIKANKATSTILANTIPIANVKSLESTGIPKEIVQQFEEFISGSTKTHLFQYQTEPKVKIDEKELRHFTLTNGYGALRKTGEVVQYCYIETKMDVTIQNEEFVFIKKCKGFWIFRQCQDVAVSLFA